jgi:hypothetical protein
MSEEKYAKILSHISNSAVIQLPDRSFPSIALQLDSLSIMLVKAEACMREFKKLRHEEGYYEALMLAQDLQVHLIHFEDILRKMQMSLPYKGSERDRLIEDDYNDSE